MSDPFEQESAEDLARSGKKCYASPVVTIAEVTDRKLEYEAFVTLSL